MNKKFYPHGEYNIEVEQRLIIARLIAGFNEQSTKNYCVEMSRAIHYFNERNFCILLDLTQFEGCTPDSFNESIDLVQLLRKPNTEHILFVCKSSLYMDMCCINKEVLKNKNIKYKI